MSNFEPDDIERSLKRFVAGVTGQQDDTGAEWSVETQDAQVPDERRPFVIITPTDEAAPTFARATIPQGDLSMRQPFVVTAYPSVDGTPAETNQRARKLAQAFLQSVTVGMVDDDGELLSWPLSVPVYDYAGVPIRGTAEERRGPDDPYGVVEVESVAARAIPDPLDDRRWTVAVPLRLTWWTGGRLRAAAAEDPPIAGVPGTWVVPPGA